jgi:TatD family hydrolase
MWIDTHAHLAELGENEYLQVIQNAKNAELGGIINIGTNPQENITVIKQAKINTSIKTFAVVGIAIPESADFCGNFDWVGELETLAQDESVVAIGETGIDFAAKESYPPVEQQLIVFNKHIEIAKKLNKPMVIHSRAADEEAFKMCAAAGLKKVVFHCFTGSAETARKIAAAGYYISFSGIATFKNSGLDDSIKAVPADKILIETDSPWLAGFKEGELHSIAMSHGEGKFVVSEQMARELFENGRVAFQYEGENPNGSFYAIEGITDPSGQILGKMGHMERYERNIFKNIAGNKTQDIFINAVNYFKKQ